MYIEGGASLRRQNRGGVLCSDSQGGRAHPESLPDDQGQSQIAGIERINDSRIFRHSE